MAQITGPGTLPPQWQQNYPTQPGQFFSLTLGSFLIGGGMAYTDDERYSGSWEQPFGQSSKVRQPGMRDGTGHFTHFMYVGQNLRDAINSLNLSGVDGSNPDFRFIPFTMTATYNDGVNPPQTRTLFNVFITRIGENVTDGTRLMSEDVDFDYDYGISS